MKTKRVVHVIVEPGISALVDFEKTTLSCTVELFAPMYKLPLLPTAIVPRQGLPST
jgi:hypothetical protein